MGAPVAAPSDEPQSWGEAIQRYAKDKQRRPRPDSEYVKPPRVTRYEKSRQEVEYHPILQTFSDRPREQAAVAHEETSRLSHLNKAKDKQIRTRPPLTSSPLRTSASHSHSRRPPRRER